jgi:hypothetical protein
MISGFRDRYFTTGMSNKNDCPILRIENEVICGDVVASDFVAFCATLTSYLFLVGFDRETPNLNLVVFVFATRFDVVYSGSYLALPLC